MTLLHLSLLVIFANVAIDAEITNITNIVLPEAKNAFKFEDQDDAPQSYGLIRFEGQNDRFQNTNNHHEVDNESQRIKFQDENTIENQRPTQQKKKRRRRKPRQRFPNQVPGFQNGVPGYPPGPGPVLPGPVYPGVPYPQTYPGQFYRPRPPASTDALSAVTDALTSIAQYDDRQCVARLLCEAAGGAGSEGGENGAAGGLIKAITGLQPLLTLLAAYNGISSSPLFVFGRAVFLGMTSKANPGTCRYAYPDCPTDPEQLVHYLNNHNGGFFRFFSAPQPQEQNLEQFYNQLGQSYGYYDPQQNQQQNVPFSNQLSGQNYGYYDPQQNQQQNVPFSNQLSGQNYGYYDPQQNQQQNVPFSNQLSGQNYGYYEPQQNLPQDYNQQSGQNYGYYEPQNLQQNGYSPLRQNPAQQLNYNPNYLPYPNQQKGLPNQYLHNGYVQYSQPQKYQHLKNQKPSLSGSRYGLYGQAYPYQQNFSNYRLKSNKIEKRIQNIRNTEPINDNVSVGNGKWIFPDNSHFNNKVFENVRLGKGMKFPESNVNSDKAAKGFVFPGSQSNRDYILNNIEAEDDDFVFDGPATVNDFRFENQQKYREQYNNGNSDDDINENGVRVLYIVRGNGDPNNPEIVRLPPGQSL